MVYRVTFENTESQLQIVSTMADYGSTKIAEGKSLYETSRFAFDSNQTETDEASAVCATVETKKDQLDKIYSANRKKAKVVFRDDSVTAGKLEISGTMTVAYVKWLETVCKVFKIAFANTDIRTKLARLKISFNDLYAAQAMIPEVETLRSGHLKGKGESQDATTVKDTAFAKVDDWMSEF